MGMVAILVMWPWPFEGTFIRLYNLASIGPVASEEMFENVDGWKDNICLPIL